MKNLVGAAARGFRTVFAGGTSLFWLAPIIPLIAIVPEFVQHVAEIRMGMFESREAFSALANDETRWMFGFAKIAGLFIAILAASRYWGGQRESWWDLRNIAWKPFLIAVVLQIALAGLLAGLEQVVPASIKDVVDLAIMILTLPLLVYLVGPILGDHTMTLKRAYSSGWLKAIAIGVFGFVAFWPAQQLHGLNHEWAFGAAAWQVWALMIWDTLLVGLMACWMGSALAAGYLFGEPAEDHSSMAAPEPAA
ncbi:hypothetical protein KUW15_13465 [Qipengyuania aquimaris]|uniref:hypothetical protein n=1 Tax=Qipengyuania aquimaris TaxID=255984 RepID=UPI001C971A49|nr:hypothetical protein [Qipengyuania aquimaris]MBY6129724.1 hypothetical protein [Qipengyuania aquimaris]